MNYNTLLSISRAHAGFMNPNNRVAADFFISQGQSNMTGSLPNEESGTRSNTSVVVQRSPQARYSVVVGMQNGANQSTLIGQSSPLPAFGLEWTARTGRIAIFAPFAYAGTPLTVGGLPDSSRYWDPVPSANSMLGGATIGEDYARGDLVREAFEAIELHPRWMVQNRIILWNGGEADGLALATNRITQSDYEQAMVRMFEYQRDTFGVNRMFVFELGREGNTAQAVATNETAQGMSAIRAAQNNVANSHTQIDIIFTGAKELGTPFNTVVEANGYHVSGFVYRADGVHYTGQSYRLMGTTGARNGAALIP